MGAVLTVSQLNRYLASKIRGDDKLKTIAIKGEISNLTMNYTSGHMYFSLKDDGSSLRVVMFKSSTKNLKIELEDGLSVLCLGNIDCYERNGEYQLITTDIQVIGSGIQKNNLEELKLKFMKLGCFDIKNKKQIPERPKTIGIITSLTGAALQDILNILKRRYPIVSVKIFPTLVQGVNIGKLITTAIRKADNANLDTLILARGGGSAEDLSCFNDESVVMAIYEANTPIISAVGHETDVTLSDLAADLRAPTPSAAAELASPLIDNYVELLDQKFLRMKQIITRDIQKQSENICHIEEALQMLSPKKKLEVNYLIYKNLFERLERNMKRSIETSNSKFTRTVTLLESLSPLNVLSRGYSIVTKNEKVLRDEKEVQIGDSIGISFKDTSISATVTDKNKSGVIN